MKNKGTIIFFSTPAYGHVNPALPIVNHLVCQGYKVVFYSSEEFRKAASESGAEFRCYDFGKLNFDPQIGSRILCLTELILHFTNNHLEEFVNQVKAISPVLIIHDTLAFWGRAVAQILGIKAVSLNTLVTVPRYFSKTFLMYTIRFTGSSMQELKCLPNIIRSKKELKAKYHLRHTDLLSLLMNQERLNVYTYPRAVHPDGRKMRKNHFFLGTSALLRKNNFFVQEKYDKKNLIYVSLGTVFNSSHAFWERIFSGFAGSEYNLVVSCGAQYEKLLSAGVPDNIMLRKYVDQKKILQNAVLFITAGGMNSICEAAANGVPCLLCPQQGEQAINAKSFEHLGLGKILKKSDRIFEASVKMFKNFKVNENSVKEFSTVRMKELTEKIQNYISRSEG
ncbi:MAG: hypothetical protein IJ192_13135 [Clostridia bacterium]|nr:hypothetical protein [Clostridia bacterium]